jgi:hypothetical protein
MLFLLTRKKFANYDQNLGFVVRAKSAREARKLVNDFPNLDLAEGTIWEDAALTKCERVKEEGEAEVILRSFKAG